MKVRNKLLKSVRCFTRNEFESKGLSLLVENGPTFSLQKTFKQNTIAYNLKENLRRILKRRSGREI